MANCYMHHHQIPWSLKSRAHDSNRNTFEIQIYTTLFPFILFSFYAFFYAKNSIQLANVTQTFVEKKNQNEQETKNK